MVVDDFADADRWLRLCSASGRYFVVGRIGEGLWGVGQFDSPAGSPGTMFRVRRRNISVFVMPAEAGIQAAV